MFVDTHCHLDQLADAKKAMETAIAVGVQKVIAVSVDMPSMEKNLQLSKKLKGVCLGLGVHPCDLLQMDKAQVDGTKKFMEQHLKDAICIGEVGLDYKWAKTVEQRKLQDETFRHYIKLAKSADLPLNVHSRWAEEQVLKVLQEENAEKVLMHWFTNKPEAIAKAVSYGYYISAGPTLLINPHAQEVVKGIPLENLCLETDSPVPFNGKPAAPDWIPKVAEKLAELKGVPVKEVEGQTSENAQKLFKFM